MSSKINIPLFIFALMIQCLFVGIMSIPSMPLSIAGSLPSFSNPSAYLAGINGSSNSSNFGIQSIPTDAANNFVCAADWFQCAVSAITQLWNFIALILNFIIMGINIIIYLVTMIFGILTFLLTALAASVSLLGSSVFPVWIGLPLGIILLAANLIVIIDIGLVVKGLIENII